MSTGAWLPHTGRALLLSRVVRHGADELDAEAEIGEDYPLAQDGRVPALVGIEIGAQAAGALEALSRGDGKRPSGGRLVRVDSAIFHCDTLPTRSIIAVRAERDALLPPLAKYRVAISASGTPCVDCAISIFLLG